MVTTPNQAVMAAYSPRTVGPTARARSAPARLAVPVARMLKPAVRATAEAIAERLRRVPIRRRQPPAACAPLGGRPSSQLCDRADQEPSATEPGGVCCRGREERCAPPPGRRGVVDVSNLVIHFARQRNAFAALIFRY